MPLITPLKKKRLRALLLSVPCQEAVRAIGRSAVSQQQHLALHCNSAALVLRAQGQWYILFIELLEAGFIISSYRGCGHLLNTLYAGNY